MITRYGDRFDYASPEETPALMTDLVDWYNEEEAKGEMTPVQLAALFHYRLLLSGKQKSNLLKKGE